MCPLIFNPSNKHLTQLNKDHLMTNANSKMQVKGGTPTASYYSLVGIADITHWTHPLCISFSTSIILFWIFQ